MMGLLQKACETYDYHKSLVGVIQSDCDPLAPISHSITAAQIEITINDCGEFVQAVGIDKKAPKTIIPVTEDSGGRTSAPCAHPLCDSISYVAPYDENRHRLYVEALTEWAESDFSHPILRPILTYVSKGTVLDDLSRAGLLKTEDGEIKNEKDLIRWRVIGIGSCWDDPALFDAFIRFYENKQKSGNTSVCMISGDTEASARQHPKGIIPINGNAKLISANDKANFTYLGRLTDEMQTASVGYIASQKAHNALRWLASRQWKETTFDKRTILCWNPKGKPTPQVHKPFPSKNQEKAVTPTAYQDMLRKVLQSYRSADILPDDEDVCVAVFDAATKGRLALVYYSEWKAYDFLKRLAFWDETCLWYHFDFETRSYFMQSPDLPDIVRCAFGTERTSKGKSRLEADDKIMSQQILRLLECRINQGKMPLDMMRAVTQKASNPLAFDKCRNKVLETACAVIWKYKTDQGERWEMSLEKDKKDRSYQFGRLLAVMEKAERDTYDEKENREPNAIRLQSTFCQRPFATAKIIIEQLKRGYYQKLKPDARTVYEKYIGEIFEIVSDFSDEERNRPLTESYLLGYYLQKKELYTSHKENAKTEDKEV